jgi:hypothetical protein
VTEIQQQHHRYVEVFADLTLDGKPVKVKVWVDLLAIANEMAPKALRSKTLRAIDVKGAVIVTVVT